MPDQPKRYILKTESVKASLQRLVALDVHRSFAGYLCVLRAAETSKATEGLRPPFRALFDHFFKVRGAPIGSPYVVPFGVKEKTGAIFFNRNVAGSYAPSSLRGVNPFRTVVSVSGSNDAVTYSLAPDHAELARTLLTKGSGIPGAALAAYLYRDYFFLSDLPPDPPKLFSVFREDFGFAFHGSSAQLELVFGAPQSVEPSIEFEEYIGAEGV